MLIIKTDGGNEVVTEYDQEKETEKEYELYYS